MFSRTETQVSPGGVEFVIWGRDSGVHFDVSVECSDASYIASADGQKYHGHCEHPEDQADCDDRVTEIKASIAIGNPL